MTRWNPKKVVAYLLVIGISTGIDVGLVLTSRRVLPLLLAVLLGFAGNVTSGYVLSRHFVFLRATARHASATWRFAVLVGVNVAIGVLVVTVMVSQGVPYLLARVISSGVLVPTNYVVMRSWVFAEA
jgi:putative flippase GtrA